MLENFTTLFKKMGKKDQADKSKNAAKERLHLVLMQDRANVSADFLEMMKQEIVDVIKKYIDVDETDMDVKLENRTNNDGTTGAPALYANIPIVAINEEKKKESEEITKAKKVEEELEIEEENVEKAKKAKTTKATKTKDAKKAVSAKKATTKTAKVAKKETAKSVLAKTARKKKSEKEDSKEEKTEKSKNTEKKTTKKTAIAKSEE